MTTGREFRRSWLILISGAFAAYLAANLIHNNFALDPVIAPAALFVGLLFWRRRRVFLLAAAVVIVVPAYSFLRWSELLGPADALHFLNHLALLAAAVLGLASAVVAVVPGRRTTSRGKG